MITMNRVIIILAVISFAVCGVSADQNLIDVVYLQDGTTLQGVIIEQNAGISVKLATQDLVVYTFEDKEIERIEKRKTKESIPIYYTDTVFLNDGVIFSGTIVEQRPAQSIVLQTENGIHLQFPLEDIWKIGKQKHPLGMPELEQEETAPGEREGFRIRLHIELVQDRIDNKERAAKEGEEVSSELQEELDRMKEEMQDLEEIEAQNEQTVLDQRRAVEREEIEELYREIEDLLEELFNTLQECEAVPAVEEEQGTALGTIDRFHHPDPIPLHLVPISGFGDSVDEQSSEIAQITDTDSEEVEEQLKGLLSGVVEQTLDRLPIEDEIQTLKEAQQARSQIQNILTSKKWWKLISWQRIYNQAGMLPSEDRLFLYESYKQRDQLRGVALNSIPFLYLGSWNQKDGFGIIVGYLQTTLCLVTGLAMYGLNSEPRIVQRGTVYYEYPHPTNSKGWLGVGIIGASYAFGLIEPFWYVARRNNHLREALQVDRASLRKERARTSLAVPQVWIDSTDREMLRVGVNLVSLQY